MKIRLFRKSARSMLHAMCAHRRAYCGGSLRRSRHPGEAKKRFSTLSYPTSRYCDMRRLCRALPNLASNGRQCMGYTCVRHELVFSCSASSGTSINLLFSMALHADPSGGDLSGSDFMRFTSLFPRDLYNQNRTTYNENDTQKLSVFHDRQYYVRAHSMKLSEIRQCLDPEFL